jgi:MoxR-like ATPase
MEQQRVGETSPLNKQFFFDGVNRRIQKHFSQINMSNQSDIASVQSMAEASKTIQKEISKAIIGQHDIIEQLLISLFSRGHCLLVGVPGLAKTLLIRTLSKSLNLTYNRIQFTPDLMPSDITGTEVIEDDVANGRKQFRFVKGPIFSNIVLADEINRTPPKTQAALLEAMQEHSVTNGGKTYQLEQPFFVLATQNPIEQEGTYPLPEAQLDRFMFNLWLDYPSEAEEADIVRTTTTEIEPEIKPVLSASDIMHYQDIARKIPVADNVINYAVSLVRATRPQTTQSKTVKDLLSYGAGPRASQYLVLGAKTRAALRGAFTPEIDDIRAVAEPVLRHRIVTNFSAEADNITPSHIISMLLKEI